MSDEGSAEREAEETASAAWSREDWETERGEAKQIMGMVRGIGSAHYALANLATQLLDGRKTQMSFSVNVNGQVGGTVSIAWTYTEPPKTQEQQGPPAS